MFLLLLLVLLCILLLHYRLTKHYTYWLKKDVPCPKPSLLFGNTRNVALLETTIGENLQKIYKEYEGYPFVGIYELGTPALLLKDLKLIKHVLAKDFVYFQSRGIIINEKTDPLSANLINLSGQQWQILRKKLTPAFTTGKIRYIFETFTEVSERFKQFIKQYADNEELVEFGDLTTKFTIQFIGICFFGLETNTIQKDYSEFQKMCKKAIDPSLVIAIKRLVRNYMPGIFKSLSMYLIPSEVTAYFMGITKHVIAHRETNNITLSDIMQVLMELKYKSEQQDTSDQLQDIVIDDKVVAAQAFVFLMAGYHTSSTTMSFVMYELALNPEIQKKLYTEVQTISKKYGCLSYDAISEMEYLDRVIRETLRKYPPVGMTQRMCEESYKIPDTDVVIEKGTKVLIPIYAIHHDPLYYKDPDIFDPDRFLDENKKLRDSYTFLPFGEGPRICIGMRFAYVLTKVGILAIIANYEVELSKRTPVPLKFDPTAITLTSKSGIWLKVRHRHQDLTGKQS